jgi:hypothetical protein
VALAVFGDRLAYITATSMPGDFEASRDLLSQIVQSVRVPAEEAAPSGGGLGGLLPSGGGASPTADPARPGWAEVASLRRGAFTRTPRVVFISIIQSGNAPLEDVRGMTARDSMMLYNQSATGSVLPPVMSPWRAPRSPSIEAFNHAGLRDSHPLSVVSESKNGPGSFFCFRLGVWRCDAPGGMCGLAVRCFWAYARGIVSNSNST